MTPVARSDLHSAPRRAAPSALGPGRLRLCAAGFALGLLLPGVLQAQPADASAPPRLSELAVRSGYTVIDTVPGPGRSPAAAPAAAPAGDRPIAAGRAADALCVPTPANDPAASGGEALRPAASAGSADRSEAPASRRADREPDVRCSVFDTEGGRIEELRVRGQVQRVRVQPPGTARAYEIQLLDAGRDSGAKSGPGRGGEGQRVWPVLSF